MHFKKSILILFIILVCEICAGTPTSNAGTDVPSYEEVEQSHIKSGYSAFVTVEVTITIKSYKKEHHWIKVINVHAAGPSAPIDRLTNSPPKPRIRFEDKALCTKTFIEDLAAKGWESSPFAKEILKKGSYRTLILITYDPSQERFEPYFYDGNANHCLGNMLRYRDDLEESVKRYTKSFTDHHGPSAAK